MASAGGSRVRLPTRPGSGRSGGVSAALGCWRPARSSSSRRSSVSRSGRSTSASSPWVGRCSTTCRSCTSTRRSRTTGRGDPLAAAGAARRARPARRRHARAPRAPRTRASSATRSPTRTCSASAAGAGLGATLAIAYDSAAAATLDLPPVAAFVGATLGVGARLPARAGRPARRETDDAHARGRDRRLVPDRGADVRAAAERGHAAGGLQLDPRPPRDLGLDGRADRAALRRRQRGASCSHRRLLDVLSVGDDEASTLGVKVGARPAARGRRRHRSGPPPPSRSAA